MHVFGFIFYQLLIHKYPNICIFVHSTLYNFVLQYYVIKFKEPFYILTGLSSILPMLFLLSFENFWCFYYSLLGNLISIFCSDEVLIEAAEKLKEPSYRVEIIWRIGFCLICTSVVFHKVYHNIL